MARIIFRGLIVLTIAGMLAGRYSGGRMPEGLFVVFYDWFLASIVVFGAFGLYSAWMAWKDAVNRRAYLFDIVLAVVWVYYWYMNLRPRIRA